MKVKILLPFFIILFLFSSCGISAPEPETEPVTEPSQESIQVKTQMTMARDIVYDNLILTLEMIRGTYTENWDPGPYTGRAYEGDFILCVYTTEGKKISSIPLESFDSNNPLVFLSTFHFGFDDYNADSAVDFTIGQYATSNGNDYKLFTLRKDGTIGALQIKDRSTLFVSDRTDYYSTIFQKEDDKTFSVEFYDNAASKSFRNNYRWNGVEFECIKTIEVN